MLTLLLSLSSPAHATPPHTITLSDMVEHEGLPVLDAALLGASYRELVTELGAAIASPSTTPTHTLGLDGWEAGLYEELVFTEAKLRDETSPWERSHPEEDLSIIYTSSRSGPSLPEPSGR